MSLRGLLPDTDIGNNTLYYLWSGAWYRMMSPHCMWPDDKDGAIAISVDGALYGNFIPNAGGVQF